MTSDHRLQASRKRKSYSKDEWARRLEEMHVSKHALNSLIMNYLVVEGYQDAAAKFAQEAKINLASPAYGLAPPLLYTPDQAASAVTDLSSSAQQDVAAANAEYLASVHDRMVIKSLILSGQIQAAIEKINDLDPELLDIYGDLHFALLRLQLIELIRQANNNSTTGSGDIVPALEFATSHLARRAPANPQFLADLEQTMALLCFPPNNLVPQLRQLMDLNLRQTVARQVNTTLLNAQGINGDSKIANLVKLWGWAEHELESKENVVFPALDKSTFS